MKNYTNLAADIIENVGGKEKNMNYQRKNNYTLQFI